MKLKTLMLWFIQTLWKIFQLFPLQVNSVSSLVWAGIVNYAWFLLHHFLPLCCKVISREMKQRLERRCSEHKPVVKMFSVTQEPRLSSHQALCITSHFSLILAVLRAAAMGLSWAEYWSRLPFYGALSDVDPIRTSHSLFSWDVEQRG